MAIIKCKMCGGDVELAADKTFGTCEFCGNTMTFPKVDDDQRAAAFNRGNHFRRIGEFDKALAVYERIVREDDTDAEAHWCCALCRFGIEYVEDPATFEWLPTCHRASFDSFLEDVDYLAAVEYSDGITKRQYQKDGAKIAEVQRGILATSQNEEPFDVFICYKESDESGQRTRDSLMAQDVYYQLTDQGYRVFFSRITLEDMVGKQYEPYIFAALNSAKVMIVIGTKAEYMNAVWVKNEWSRFLAMMKKDRNKLLLPCYRDMDPYDMPEQLSVLQSYDMAKIGFIQDLIRGIKKVLDAEKKTEPVHETVMVQQTNSNTVALLKRGNMALEDGEWDKADQFFEEVLNQDAECVDAYLGKTLVQLRLSKPELLCTSVHPFEKMPSYQRAMRFATGDRLQQLKSFAKQNYEFLLKCGSEALEAGDWKKAAQLYKDILNLNEACVTAYIGSFLAQARCGSLEQFIDAEIALMTSKAQPSTKTAKQEEQLRQQWLDEAMQAYHATGILPEHRIVALYPRCKTYNSTHSYLEAQRGVAETFLSENQYFQNALKYSDPQAKAKLQEQLNIWLKRIDDLIEEAARSDAAQEEQIVRDTIEALKNINAQLAKMGQEAAEIKEAEYQKLCQKQQTTTDQWGLSTLKNAFRDFGNYKDCLERAKWCQAKIAELIAQQNEREFQSKKQRELVVQWMADGKCAHCGGDFTGLFSKKCSKCGMPKNY